VVKKRHQIKNTTKIGIKLKRPLPINIEDVSGKIVDTSTLTNSGTISRVC
jgi:hypothetical protein